MRILIDSDILVDHLRGHNRFDPGDNDVFVSSVTRAELFSGRVADEARVLRLLEAMHELSVDRAVAERAGRIRRETNVRLPDALIAATAIENELALVTRNRRDFEAIPGLVLPSTGFSS